MAADRHSEFRKNCFNSAKDEPIPTKSDTRKQNTTPVLMVYSKLALCGIQDGGRPPTWIPKGCCDSGRD
jgi:hypothetical protein